MRVVVFEAEARERAPLEALKGQGEIVFVEAPLRTPNAAEYADVEVISTFIYSKISRAVLEALPGLRLVATRSTGVDHIDLQACAERGVAVANVPSYGENTVAEHVFALLLSISHRLRDALQRARSGLFSPEGLEGFDLEGKTIGVVGVGAIGRHVIAIANGFGMTAVGFDLAPDPALARKLRFEYLALDELLARSDIVTLHTPARAGGAPLLDAHAFETMKDGAVIINTARGSLVDSRALVAALASGKVAAAGLDVLPEEPMIREEAELVASANLGLRDLRELLADHVLLRMPQVLVTPHSAFNTREAVQRIVETTVSNILAFLAGRPVNLVQRAGRAPGGNS